MTAPESLTTALLERYRLERQLGEGGMAVVYLALDLKHDRQVALKVIRPEMTALLGSRFSREIRLAARLQHPHICSVYDSGETPDGQLWYTMPFIAGESLRDRLTREDQLPIAEAVRIAREAAQGLEYAHRQGVIHRDIKPENILLTEDGTTLVADFGIAKGGATTQLTEAGHVIGTPAYMSPEQRLGDSVDPRSDVYSLAATLFELLTGERAAADGGGMDAFLQQMTDPAPYLRIKRREIPEPLEAAVRQGLHPDPAHRFNSMAAFSEALGAAISGQFPAAASGPGVLRRLSDFVGGLLAPKRIPAPPVAAAPNTIAVLPFRDMSPAQGDTYFSDGLAEELASALSRIPELRVAARSGAFQYRGAGIDLRAAGRTLGVGAVVIGSVRRSGERLRIGAQLVGVQDGFELWSESYDRELADVFQVQEEIARAIAAALRLKLLGPAEAALVQRPTTNLEAYDLYLQGRFAWHQRTGATLVQAARCFEEAAARDPSFARAWAGLADAGTLLPLYTGTPPAEAWPQAKAAALRAIGLDPGLAEAHTSLAYGTMLFEWDWAAADRAFTRAIAADPNYPMAHHWYGDFLAGRGRLEESLAAMQRARVLDPLSRITGVEVGWVFYLLRRNAEADAALAEVLRLDPTYSHAHFVVGMLRLTEGRAVEAVQNIRHSIELGGFHAHAAGALIAAQAAGGDRETAMTGLARLEERSAREYVPAFAFVLAHAGLGNLDGAFAALERGFVEYDVLLAENFFEPMLDPLRGDSRYEGVAARIRGEEPRRP